MGVGPAAVKLIDMLLGVRWALVAMMVWGVCGGLEAALAHPEDEICGPGSTINPALCRQLAEINRSAAELAQPLVGEDGEPLSAVGAAWYFLKIGVQHILPGGTDHILFVLALFLSSQRLRELALQISTFTVAHTATLGLTAAGVLQPPASLVEPLIALSIAFVAVETLVFKDLRRWRYLIIFGFGLFHGMGFAGFISEIGLPTEQFWPALFGFNVGVEIGQLAVVFVAYFVALYLKREFLTRPESYRRYIVQPAAILIAATGSWWFLTRSLEVVL
ncbi:MAG: HupE/UreJ family protein [Pseudomonadota bacterium]